MTSDLTLRDNEANGDGDALRGRPAWGLDYQEVSVFMAKRPSHPIVPGTTIRVFVSSTFADFQQERELLQRNVFPVIAKLCLSEGFRFLPIDLRWGVSEQAGTAQRTLPIIFDELRRCQRESPEFNFMLLLGDRYGSRLLPDSIPAVEYVQLYALMNGIDQTLLEKAYRLDENAVPPIYVLRPRRELSAAATAATHDRSDTAWRAEVADPLLTALADAASRADLSPQFALPYTGSVTHREVQQGLLDVDDPSAALCVFRTVKTVPNGSFAREYIESDSAARQKLVALKSIVGDRLATYGAAQPDKDLTTLRVDYQTGWDKTGLVLNKDALADQLTGVLEVRVRDVIARRRADTRSLHPVEVANARFAAERLEHFVGREQPLAAIAGYLAALAEVPLVVTGSGGVGKSTLLARAVEQASTDYPDTLLLARYVGVTPGAENLRVLLDGLRAELATAYGQETLRVSEDWERARAFRDALGWATAERPLILVLDALDQLGPPPVPLDWLPETLPQHVHLIVSLLDEADRSESKTLSTQRPVPLLVPLGRMNEAEGDVLLSAWLEEAGRTLKPEQRMAVLAAFAHEGRPLYLRLAFEEARRWHSFVTLAILPPLDPTIPGILHARFGRLERPYEHGPVLTSHTLGLLRAAKNGLAEDELLALLARDDDVREEQHRLAPFSPLITPELPLPTALWALLYADLAPYLTEREADGTRLLAFYHHQLAEVAAERYLKPPHGSARHQALASYFEAQPLMEGTSPNLRKLAEQPTQEAAGGLSEVLRNTLTDLNFLEQKIAYRRTIGALDDLALAPANDAVLRDVAAALRLGAHILDTASDQTESQMWARLPDDVRAHLHDPPARRRLRLDSRSLTQVGEPQVRTFVGHVDVVWACAFSPDGRFALSASADKTLRLWDVTSGREVRRFDGHSEGVTSCAFSPDGYLALSGSNDHTVRLWDVTSGREVRSLTGHTSDVYGCVFSPDGTFALSASADMTLRLWEVASGREVRRFEGHTEVVSDCAFSPDGTRALSASWDGTLRLWAVATGSEVKRLDGRNDDRVLACAFSPDGTRALSTSDYNVRLWNVATGHVMHCLVGLDTAVPDGTFSPDGLLALTAAADRTLYLWEAATGHVVRRFEGHTGWVEGCAFSPDGHLILSASTDQTLRLWEAPVDQEVEPRAPALIANPYVVLPDDGHGTPGKYSVGHDTTSTRNRGGVAEGHIDTTAGRDHVSHYAISPNWKLALTAGTDGSLSLWDVATWREVHRLKGHTAAVIDCAFSPDGTLILSAAADKTLILWDVATGHPVHALAGPLLGLGPLGSRMDPISRIDEVQSCAFSPDGRLVLSAWGNRISSGQAYYLWDVATGSEVRRFGSRFGSRLAPTTRCAFSPNGALALTASGRRLQLWEVSTGREVLHLEGHVFVRLGAFSPDGALALSAVDNELRLWDVATGSEVRSLKGDTAAYELHSCAFSPDGSLVLTAAYHSCKLWDVATGSEVARWVNDMSVNYCAFNPNTARIVAGDVGGTLHFLSVQGIRNEPRTKAAQKRRSWWQFWHRDTSH